MVIIDLVNMIIELFKLVFKGFSNFISVILLIPQFLFDFANILPFPLSAIARFFVSILVFLIALNVLRKIIEVLSPIIDIIKEKLGTAIMAMLGGGG